jgi:hypothetical protein
MIRKIEGYSQVPWPRCNDMKDFFYILINELTMHILAAQYGTIISPTEIQVRAESIIPVYGMTLHDE